MEEKIRILFVEDAPLDAELVCRAIRKEKIDFDKVIVETEDRFRIAIEGYCPDLIISDYSLPQFDGLSALRIRNSDAPGTPFILVTGSVNEEIAVECMKAGADDYVIKKNLSRLGPAIRAVMSKRKTVQQKETAERELLESYEFNRSVIKTIPFGIDIVDESGTILFQSDILKKLSGGERTGLKCWNVYRDDKLQCSDCPLVKGIVIGETESYESSGIMGGRIFEIVHTGMIYQGKKAMLEIFLDITERKKMEDKIIKSEAHYKALTDLSPDGIVIADFEGNVKYVSKRVFSLFEIPEAQNLIGESVLNWVSPDYHESVINRIAELISGTDTPDIREYLLLKNDRTPFWAELASSSIPGAGGKTNELVVVCRDITERKKISDELVRSKIKAEESDRLKTAFLHNISHEIRTPMNAIVGFSALLGDPDLEFKTRQSYLEVIMNNSQHLLVLLNDIIDIAHIEAGTIKIEKQLVNVNNLMQTLYNQFLPKAQVKELGLRLECPLADDESRILTDRVRLQQILSNLMNNALKFTSEGSVVLGYSSKGNYLEFYVTDTGIGIAPEFRERIFDRFFQIEDPVTKVFEGLGLGLSIAQSYVGFLEGSLEVESFPGKGSRFYFSIPAVVPGKINGNKILQDPNEYMVFRSRKKILVAEDNESNFRLINYFLANINAEIIHAADGRTAVNICSNLNDIDLVLMDIRMPQMDGLKATKIIKKARPGLPVIIQTAYSEDKEAISGTGCDASITKPFDKARLHNAIRSVMKPELFRRNVSSYPTGITV
jgi:PAS domain S-box-containing protein